MLGLYAAAARYAGGGGDSRLYWPLGGIALSALLVAVLGWRLGWQHRRGLLIGWPVAALMATVLTGLLDPTATHDLPGTITIAFAYLGLTCGRGRSLLLVPLGVAAFVVGGGANGVPTVVVTAIMWVLVAEVPAWLIARLEAQSMLLRQIAQTDALTQLLDRSTLATRLSEHSTDSAVMVIDLDGFKVYNDNYGHADGDRLLVAFADALRWSIRPHDLAFRLGGDEFLVILVGADRDEAAQVLDRLRRRWVLAETPVSFSVGIAAGEQDPIRLADERMYLDKRSRGLAAD